MTLENIGVGLKTRLETIAGLKAFGPNQLPDSVNQFPAALILPGETIYHATFRGEADTRFRVLLLVSKQDTPSALSRIYPYVEDSGASSIKAAVEADRTLGANADDCKVTRNLGMGITAWGGHQYLSSEFEVLVWT